MNFEQFDPLSPEHQADPFRTYADLARRGPLHRTRSGLWLVSGHTLAGEVLRNRVFRTDYSKALQSAYGPDFRLHASLRALTECFVLNSEKAEGELRKFFARALSPAAVQVQSGAIRALAQPLLKDVKTRTSIDLLRQFTIPLTLQVVCLILAVPMDLADDIPSVSGGLLKALDCAKLGKEELAQLDTGTQEFCDKLAAYLRSPAAGESECIAQLLRIAQAHALSPESLATDLLFVFLSGFETTSSVLAQVAGFLGRHPEVTETVNRQPAAIPQIVDEFVRLHPPIHIVTRRPIADANIAEQLIRNSATVLVLIGAANRDPTIFENPDAFVLNRPKAPSVTFGAGAHSCIGASLAREELAIGFEVLSADRELLGEYRASWRRTGVFRSLASMQMVRVG